MGNALLVWFMNGWSPLGLNLSRGDEDMILERICARGGVVGVCGLCKPRGESRSLLGGWRDGMAP
jgi:hypothetical protein